MTYRRAACLGAAAGAGFAGAIAATVTLRAAYTITRARRWYQIKHL